MYKDISFFDKNNDNFVPAAQNTMFIEGSANVEENNYLPESVENSLIPLEDVGVNDYLPKEIMQDDLAIPAA
ncbi:MAG: hypothetical protein LBF15_05130 [Candidatus Peribacteria bacterium]|nr:hypothetical protein [Candidatus Peribacteria bacterium]